MKNKGSSAKPLSIRDLVERHMPSNTSRNDVPAGQRNASTCPRRKGANQQPAIVGQLPATANPKARLIALEPHLLKEILGFLLPDRDIIKPRVVDTRILNGKPPMVDPMWGPTLLREDGDPCHVSILRVCKTLHKLGVNILYDRKFQVVVSARGTDFLLHHFAWQTRGKNITENTYAPYTNFPFNKIRALQVSIWPAHLNFFLFHIQEEIIAFCRFLDWLADKQNQNKRQKKPLYLRALEVEFARGSGWVRRMRHGTHHYWEHMYSSGWPFSTAKDTTGAGKPDVELLLEPFIYIRDGIRDVSIIFPTSYERGWYPPTAKENTLIQEPTCQEVINIAHRLRLAIQSPQHRSRQSMGIMINLTNNWWRIRMAGFRWRCQQGDHAPIDLRFFTINSNPSMRNCFCQGSIFGPDFEIFGERKRRLGYPNGRKEQNERCHRPQIYQHPTVVVGGIPPTG